MQARSSDTPGHIATKLTWSVRSRRIKPSKIVNIRARRN